MRASQQDFEYAVNQVKLLKKDPGNQVKLQLYALYKQATVGPCNVPKSGVFDIVSKAKWEAWNALGSLPQETARQNYVDLLSSLSPSSEASSQGKSGTDVKVHEFKDIVVTSEDGITKIMFNRPSIKNAISLEDPIKRTLAPLQREAILKDNAPVPKKVVHRVGNTV